MTRTISAATALLFTLAAVPIPAQGPRSAWNGYVKSFDAFVAADSVAGAATMLLLDGRISARHEVGMADLERAQPVDSSTIFHWGSITKTLTAIAVMQLVERGKLSLDTRLTDYIPELRQVHDPYGSMDSVTVQMLLSHASGLQGPTWPWTRGRDWEPFEPTTWAQLVAMMPYQEVAFKPGARFSYSNPGFIYLARIVELITDDPWEAYVQKNIFAPLGITRSYFNSTPYYLEAYRSNSYVVWKDSTGRVSVTAIGRDFDPGITIPNGGWNAPLGDMATYVAFLTGATGGDTARRRRYETVLPRATLERLWRARYAVDSGDRAGDSMASAFFVSHRGGVTFVGHTGSQAGFTAFVFWVPSTRAAVIAAFNTIDERDEKRYFAGFTAVRDSAWAMLRR